MLNRFSSTPGMAALPARAWPGGTHLRLSQTAETIVVFVQPECECTAATMAELARIMAKTSAKARAYVLSYHANAGSVAAESHPSPPGTGGDIPGVEAQPDWGGADAKRFGAWTSGQVMVYAPTGTLHFSGGITAARGHAGDNAGEDAVVEWITRGASAVATTPVFGCHLFRASDDVQEGEAELSR